MKKHSRFLFFILTLLLMALSGCSGATPTTEIATEESAPTPELATVSEPEAVNECLDCHTDKQRLIDTAKPEEVVVSESEGAG